MSPRCCPLFSASNLHDPDVSGKIILRGLAFLVISTKCYERRGLKQTEFLSGWQDHCLSALPSRCALLAVTVLQYNTVRYRLARPRALTTFWAACAVNSASDRPCLAASSRSRCGVLALVVSTVMPYSAGKASLKYIS